MRDMRISDILSLDIFHGAKFICGRSGVENNVSNISVLESPIECTEELGNKNEFYLTGLFAYKDNVSKLEELFEQLVREECSGVCISDVNFSTLPQNILELCDENGLPVIVISGKISYATILQSLFRKMIESGEEDYDEKRINEIFESEEGEECITAKAKSVNRSFKKYSYVMYISIDKSKVEMGDYMAKCKELSQKEFSIIRFKKGIAVIVTFDKKREIETCNLKNKVLEIVQSRYDEYRIGISNFNSLGNLNASLREAVMANRACENIGKRVLEYKDIGIYKILFQMKSEVCLKKFRDEIIKPIEKYDRENNAQLVLTARVFVENDANVNETANKLFVHINTVRYRIDKIREIIGVKNSNLCFLEHISLGIKIDNLLKILN